jgi:hypothetical protein
MQYILGTGLSLLGADFLFKNIEGFSNVVKDFTLLGGKQNNSTNETDNNYYFEFKRLNLTFGKYPPGFNLSYEAQQIFDYLDNKGLLKKYREDYLIAKSNKLFGLYTVIMKNLSKVSQFFVK